ncbi:MAG: class I tRNA ligase family protein, partial [Rubrobacteridae bacterium]|nr:class I tRNA ligase family protein [Rubrobacteridae bacterium]
WPADLHIVGKDIIRFHCVIWPVMLMALGLELPKQVLATGFWTIGGTKMSKSLGNVVDPKQLIEMYGADSTRYFLLREIGVGLDGEYTQEALVRRINGDLANDLGNLVHRTVAMMIKYFEGGIPEAGDLTELEVDLKEEALALAGRVSQAVDNVDLREALIQIWKVISKANKYIDSAAPWALAKNGDTGHLSTVMRSLLEAIRIIAVLIAPIMPETAERIWDQLGQSNFSELKIDDAEVWHGLAPGTSVKKAPPIFPRIELE